MILQDDLFIEKEKGLSFQLHADRCTLGITVACIVNADPRFAVFCEAEARDGVHGVVVIDSVRA